MKIVKIEIDTETNDVTFYFDDSPDPWNVREFNAGTPTHFSLSVIESRIIRFNNRRKYQNV